ncbi:MAG: efflux RND transporter periplasmic adaptor subunit [Planctomycetes bacterium]|nr:efflux RND transporter periplasmic adaptor subunit [Planctomycetota bacterium]
MRILKYILPVVAIAAGAAGFAVLKAAQTEVESQTPERPAPHVSVVIARPQVFSHEVHTNGIIEPRTETTLTSEVTGRIVGLHPAFVEGGFFDAGDVLVRVDDTGYQAALAQAEANLAGATARLSREEAESALARREWEAYGEGDADPLVLRVPQLAEANAGVAGATAQLAKAKNDLERTEIKAPYAGRVRAKLVEDGQYTAAGSSIGRIYAVDYAEVRLPVSADEIGYLALPLGRVLDFDSDAAPAVTLSARIGSARRNWNARIVRTEAEVDPQTRMYYAVARVKDPYSGEFPLLPNTFVDAVITGRDVEQVYVIPRRALRPDGRVLVVDKASRLKHREVSVIRATPDSVVVSDGLEAGERIVVSELELVLEDMPVRVTIAEARP